MTTTAASWWMDHKAATLVEHGYRVIPLVPHEKRPGSYSSGRWGGYRDWSRHCDRDTTELEVQTWAQWPDAGVGIACGNVVAIDIDVLDSGAAEAVEQLAHDRFGTTPLVRVGMPPKRILVYRTETPFATLRRPPVEALGRGAQFVAFGIHPATGEPYSWRDGDPLDYPREDLPAVDEQAVRAFLELTDELIPSDLRPARLCGEARGPVGPRDPDELRGTRRGVELALGHVPNADLAYDDWIRIGHALKGALGESGRDLWHAWSASSSKHVQQETDRAWRSFKLETLRSGAGTIYQLALDRGWQPDPEIVLNARLAEHLEREGIDGHPAAGLLAALDPPATQVVLVPRTGDQFLDVLAGHVHDIAPEPEPELLDVDGLVGDLARWITDTAQRPQPWLALGAAIACIGVLTGRRHAGPTGLRGNVQIAAVAPSSAGKDHARKAIQEALHAAGLSAYLGGSEIASPQGLLAALQAHPARLYQIDEWGHWLETTIGPRAASHRQALGKLTTELFSSADGTHEGTDYADPKAKPREPLHQPTACWYCTSTGDQLWHALSTGAAEDGFLARWLLFATERRGAWRDEPDADGDLTLQETAPIFADRLVAVTEGVPTADYGGDLARHMTGLSRPRVPRATWTDEAREEDRRLRQRVESLMDEISHQEGAMRATALLGRTREHALKLALVRAVGRRPEAPELTGRDMAWARGVVEHCQLSLLTAIERHVGASENERWAKRAIDLVRRAGEDGVTRNQMTRALQRVPRRQREDLLRDLLDRGAVIRVIEETGGRPRERFMAGGSP